MQKRKHRYTFYVNASRYRNVHSGALFGQSCENRRCESTVNFKKLTDLWSISTKTAPAHPVANQQRNTTKPGRVKLRQVPHYELTENYWKTWAGKTVPAPCYELTREFLVIFANKI